MLIILQVLFNCKVGRLTSTLPQNLSQFIYFTTMSYTHYYNKHCIEREEIIHTHKG